MIDGERNDDLRVGSDAPSSPAETRCGAPWTGAWEDRVQRRPSCALPPAHDGPHTVEEAGFDGRCRRYRWLDEGEGRVEPC